MSRLQLSLVACEDPGALAADGQLATFTRIYRKNGETAFPELCKTDVAEAAIRTLDWLKEARSTGNGKKDSGSTD